MIWLQSITLFVIIHQLLLDLVTCSTGLSLKFTVSDSDKCSSNSSFNNHEIICDEEVHSTSIIFDKPVYTKNSTEPSKELKVNLIKSRLNTRHVYLCPEHNVSLLNIKHFNVLKKYCKKHKFTFSQTNYTKPILSMNEGLVVSTGLLKPILDPNIFDYTIYNARENHPLIVTARTDPQFAVNISLLKKNLYKLTDSVSSIKLYPSATSKTVYITCAYKNQKPRVITTYTINIELYTDKPDPRLKHVELIQSNQYLDPVFDMNHYSYSYYVTNDIEYLLLKATPLNLNNTFCSLHKTTKTDTNAISLVNNSPFHYKVNNISNFDDIYIHCKSDEKEVIYVFKIIKRADKIEFDAFDLNVKNAIWNYMFDPKNFGPYNLQLRSPWLQFEINKSSQDFELHIDDGHQIISLDKSLSPIYFIPVGTVRTFVLIKSNNQSLTADKYYINIERPGIFTEKSIRKLNRLTNYVGTFIALINFDTFKKFIQFNQYLSILHYITSLPENVFYFGEGFPLFRFQLLPVNVIIKTSSFEYNKNSISYSPWTSTTNFFNAQVIKRQQMSKGSDVKTEEQKNIHRNSSLYTEYLLVSQLTSSISIFMTISICYVFFLSVQLFTFLIFQIINCSHYYFLYLNPAVFWTYVLELTFIPYFASSITILLSKHQYKVEVLFFHFILASNTLKKFIAIGILTPIFYFMYGIIIYFSKLKTNLVWSAEHEQYHEPQIDSSELHKLINWIPFVSRIFVLVSSKCVKILPQKVLENEKSLYNFEKNSTLKSQKYISTSTEKVEKTFKLFSSSRIDENILMDTTSSIKSFESKVSKHDCQKNINLLDHFEPKSLPWFKTPFPVSKSFNLKTAFSFEKLVKVQLDRLSAKDIVHHATKYIGLRTFLIGYKKIKLKNSFNNLISFLMPINVENLPTLLQLKQLNIYVPYKQLHHRYKNYRLFYKSEPFSYWILLHCSYILISIFTKIWLIQLCNLILFIYTFISFIETTKHSWYINSQANMKYLQQAKYYSANKSSWPYNEHNESLKKFYKLYYKRKYFVHKTLKLKYYIDLIRYYYIKCIELNFWNTRFWFTINKFFTNSSCFHLLILLFPQAPLFCFNLIILSTILNRKNILMWIILFREMSSNIYNNFIMPITIMLKQATSNKALISLKNLKKLSLIILKTKKFTIPYLYPGIYQCPVNIDNYIITNSETGLYFQSSVPKKKSWLKYYNYVDMQTTGLKCKQLQLNGVIGLLKKEFYTSLPIQVPYSQMYQLECNIEDWSHVERLAATLHIVHYNYMKSMNHSIMSSENDMYCSVYFSENSFLYSSFLDKKNSHGYITKWYPEKNIIVIRGPSIRLNETYSIKTIEPPAEIDNATQQLENPNSCKYYGISTEGNFNDMPFISNGYQVTIKGKCVCSGILRILLPPHLPPNLHENIVVKNESKNISIIINPKLIKVEVYTYLLNNETYKEMLIKNRFIKANSNVYVEYQLLPPYENINTISTSENEGVLFIPWTSLNPPNLSDWILLRNITSGSHLENSIIHIDPSKTASAQINLPLSYESIYQSVIKKDSNFVAPLNNNDVNSFNNYAPITNNMICFNKQFLDDQFFENFTSYNNEKFLIDSGYIIFDSLPCTVIQCINPIENIYRVEPNFEDLIITTRARIEQLYGYQQDIINTELLYFIWPEFISVDEYISFWSSATNNSEIDYFKPLSEYMEFPKAMIQFQALIENKIYTQLGIYIKLHNLYLNWNYAYSNIELYSHCLLKERADWSEKKKNLPNDFEASLSYFKKTIDNFVYPLNVKSTEVKRKSNWEAQKQIWRWKLINWFQTYFKCSQSLSENISCFGESVLTSFKDNSSKTALFIVYDIIRQLERNYFSIKLKNSVHNYSPLHYIVGGQILSESGSCNQWKPDHLNSHLAMIRLFPGSLLDASVINWESPVWIPCYIKLQSHCLLLKILDNYKISDFTNKYIDVNCPTYYIPLSYFDKTIIAHEPSDCESLKCFDTKLVFQKSASCNENSIKCFHTDKSVQEIFYKTYKHPLKIALCHTLTNKRNVDYSDPDKFFISNKCCFFPLTIRFHSFHAYKWRNAIEFAQMNHLRQAIKLTSNDSNSIFNSINWNKIPSISSIADQPQSTSSKTELQAVDAKTYTLHPTTSHTQSLELTNLHELSKKYVVCGTEKSLYNPNGSLAYNGTWVLGFRWGLGVCNFTDYNGTEWLFEGNFVADEMKDGKLILIDNNLKKNLMRSKSSKTRQQILIFEGILHIGDFPNTLLHTGCILAEQPNIKVSNYCNLDSRYYLDRRRSLSASPDSNLWKMKSSTIYENVSDDFFISFDLSGNELSLISYSHNKQASLPIKSQRGTSLRRNKRFYTHRNRSPSLDIEKYITPELLQMISSKALRKTQELSPNALYKTVLDKLFSGSVRFVDGSVYLGLLENALPHGKGIFYSRQSNILYNGFWKQGQPHGFGILISNPDSTDNNTIYYGDFFNGQRFGKGVQIFDNGMTSLYGIYLNDKIDGSDCLYEFLEPQKDRNLIKIKRYAGQTLNALFHGKGQLEWTDDVYYKGDFLKGKRHGFGELRSKDHKVLISGQWVNDVPDGKVSIYLYPNEYLYDGEMKHGKRHGLGNLFHKGNLLYEGSWLNDLPNNRGVMHSVDGIYDGEFLNGKRWGKGRFEFKINPASNEQPRLYEGDWENDVPHGVGTYTTDENTKITFRVENGTLVPSSVAAYKNCNISIYQKTFKILPADKIPTDNCLCKHIYTENASTNTIIERINFNSWIAHTELNIEFVDETSSIIIPSGYECAVQLPSKTIKLERYNRLNDLSVTVKILNMHLLKFPMKKLSLFCVVRLGLDSKRSHSVLANKDTYTWNVPMQFKPDSCWLHFEVFSQGLHGVATLLGSNEFNLLSFLNSKLNNETESIILHKFQKASMNDVGVLNFKLEIFQEKPQLTKFPLSDAIYSPNYICQITIHACNINTYSRPNFKPCFVFHSKKQSAQNYYENAVALEFVNLNLHCQLLTEKNESIKLELWDTNEFLKDQLIGTRVITLSDFNQKEFNLFTASNNFTKYSIGTLSLSICVVAKQ